MATLEKNANFSGTSWGGYAKITYTAQDGTVTLSGLAFKATSSTSAKYGAYYDASQTRTFTLNSVGKNTTVKNVRIKQTSYYNATLGASQTWTDVPNNSTLNFTVRARSNSPNTLTYNFTIPMTYSTYTISYNANGGSSTPSSQTKTYGTNLTIASAINHANSTANGYTVTFNANNGSTTKTSQTATDTTTYSFSSWKSSATGATWSGGATNFNENNATTLTAQWSTSTTKGSVTLPTTSQCTRTGYTLLGFSTSSTATSATWSPGASYTPDATKTIYAVWKINTYTVTVWPGGGTYDGSTSNKSYTQNYNTTKDMGFPTPPTGNIFAGYHATGPLSGITTKDSVFENGNGGVDVYNNSGNGTVTIARSQDNSVPSVGKGAGGIGYKLTITKASGTASPGSGGFYQSQYSSANQIFRCMFWAKIPTTHYVTDHRNSIGDGGYSTWLTGRRGTGDWYLYVYDVHCGSSGTFSTFGHVAAYAIDGDNSKAVTWYLCAAQITNITASSSVKYTFTSSSPIECFYAPKRIKLTLNPSPGSGGTTALWYTYGLSTFFTNEMCTSQISTITKPTRTYYTFNQYRGDGTSGGTVNERYIYADGTFANDLATDIYKDATFTAVWNLNAPTAATISVTDTVRDKASVSLGYTGAELTDYTVYYRANSTGNYSSTSLGTSAAGTITGLQPNTNYQFYVKATNAAGNIDSSTTTAATKAYLPIANIPTASGIASNESTIGVSATGDTNAGITNYILYWTPKPIFGKELYDMPIKVLSDNSVWARIFYHNVKEGSVLFDSVSEAKNIQTADKYSRLGLLDSGDTYKINGKYEFMLCYPNESSTQYNRWKQTNAPQNEYVTPTSTGDGVATGYEAVHIDWNTNYWGGLIRQNQDATIIDTCYLSGSVGHSNWYYAIAPHGVYKRGTPTSQALSQESTYGGIELWIRVGTLPNAPFSQNLGTSTSSAITGLNEDTDYLIWATAENAGGIINSPSLTIHTPISQATVWYKRGLPSEYQSLDYIESTEDQYINLDYVLNYGDTVKGCVEYTSLTTAWRFILGVNEPDNSSPSTSIFGHNDNQYLITQIGSQTASPTTLAEANVKYNFEITLNRGSQTLVVNNNVVATTTTTETLSPYPIYLFAKNNGDTAVINASNARCYHLMIINDGQIVRDYRPCYRISDGVNGLYEIVDGIFYTSSSSALIRGNNINAHWIKGNVYIKVGSYWKLSYKHLEDTDYTVEIYTSYDDLVAALSPDSEIIDVTIENVSSSWRRAEKVYKKIDGVWEEAIN